MISTSNTNDRIDPSPMLGGAMLVTELSNMLGTLSDAKSYNQKPPIGPPEDLPKLSDKDLEMAQRTAYGQVLGKEHAYSSLKLVEDPSPVEVGIPEASSLENKSLWSIDGSNKILDYSAFQILLARAALVEYRYTKDPEPVHHGVDLLDRPGICMVDGNIFTDDIHLLGESTKNIQNQSEISWIEVMRDTDEPLIVSFDPSKSDKKPSSHASGWCIKFMQTLELMALMEVPSEKPGVVIRDGPMFPICATLNDTQKSLEQVLGWENKMMICSSKRIQESTLFVEFLLNPQNYKIMEYYFPEQNISNSLMRKLPADHILLPKILNPGHRTPFLEAVPRSRIAITKKNPELTPVCCYYMRKRKPHTIIRMEFPRKYLTSNPDLLEWSLKCVAWQHELGTKVPQVQEFADVQCQVNSEVDILQKIARSSLMQRGLQTLEVYE